MCSSRKFGSGNFLADWNANLAMKFSLLASRIEAAAARPLVQSLGWLGTMNSPAAFLAAELFFMGQAVAGQDFLSRPMPSEPDGMSALA